MLYAIELIVHAYIEGKKWSSIANKGIGTLPSRMFGTGLLSPVM